MATCAIFAEDLSRHFNGRTAVDRLSLDVYEGEVFGFLGPNGAGKTTTIRMLAGLLAPSAGRAQIAGVDPAAEPQRVRSLVGVLTESPGLYEKLSAWQNLKFYADLHGLAHSAPQIERYLKLFDLWERRAEPVSALSKGMKQKLALARALLHDPKVLFLDEPTAGLDPGAAKTVRELIAELSREQRTIFLCTHNLHEAEQLCDRIGLMKQRLLKAGPPQALKRELYGHHIVIDLKAPLVALHSRSQLDLPFVKELQIEDSQLSIALEDPQEQNPLLVKRLVELGAEIQFVREADRSLEDVYLQLVSEET